jgi:hypothetical protein
MMALASLGAAIGRMILAVELLFGLGWVAGNLFQATATMIVQISPAAATLARALV